MRPWCWRCALAEPRLVRTPDGLDLAVYEGGNPGAPPILFLHGFSQSALCWQGQMDDPVLASRFRLVAYDLRGHGASSQPTDPVFYTENGRFADDTAAVIAALGLVRPVLVGWSYAGRLVNDYLRAFGCNGIAGINYVCARTNGDPAFTGPGNKHLRAMQGSDLSAEIAAVIAFVDACFSIPPSPAEKARVLAYTMRVSPTTRRAHLSRSKDDGAILREITCPVLVTQGAEDQLVLPGLAEVTAAAIPDSRLSIYDGIGHAPFSEDRPRFNRELAAFAASCQHP
jgi:non-heme chloroperoxidase